MSTGGTDPASGLENGNSVAGEEDDTVLTISEYIEGIEAQELEADLVLGGDDGKDCTYPQGYLPRQAVFSCITCCPEGNAGVCTACSISCHDGHEVVELWTRRHFRCDCGNMKFGAGICRKFSNKDPENSENMYNQNYTGVYCLCRRPYPDPDGEKHGEMLQCCICEDWFHEAHLGLASTEEVPRDEDGEPLFDELICQSCAASLDFLYYYFDLLLPAVGATCTADKEDCTVIKDGALKGNFEVVESNKTNDGAMKESTQSAEVASLPPTCLAKVPFTEPKQELNTNSTRPLGAANTPDHGKVSAAEVDGKRPSGSAANGDTLANVETLKVVNRLSTSSQSSGISCKLIDRHLRDKAEKATCNGDKVAQSSMRPEKALFLVKNWRAQLCRCDSCQTVYAAKGVSFLLDAGDTLSQYEETAKEKHKEKREAEIGEDRALFNSLGHVGQIEFLHKLNDMASEFTSHFASFGESGRTVTSADIHEFFDNLRRKKTRHV